MFHFAGALSGATEAGLDPCMRTNIDETRAVVTQQPRAEPGVGLEPTTYRLQLEPTTPTSASTSHNSDMCTLSEPQQLP
jgi:hypothetical protein